MVEILSTNNCSSEIETLIKTTKKNLYLISPYIQLSSDLKSRLEQLDKNVPNVKVIIVTRTDKINDEDTTFFKTLKTVRVLPLHNLHAKCYMNEEFAIVTSLNLYEYSQKNNVELRVKIEKSKDNDLYDDLIKEISSILIQSERYQKYQNKVNEKDHSMIKPVETEKPRNIVDKIIDVLFPSEEGFCIRCSREIEVNPDKPLCKSCYQSWAKYGDRTYPENFCHLCGKESKQSYSKPICYNCYKKIK